MWAEASWEKNGRTSYLHSPSFFSPYIANMANLDGSLGTSIKKTSLKGVPTFLAVVLTLAISPREILPWMSYSEEEVLLTVIF